MTIHTQKIVYMGSPKYAEIILEKLIHQFNVVGVITQPDKQVGRGKSIQSPPIKILAEKNNIPVLQPWKLSDGNVWDSVLNWMPDLIIVAAFGKILKEKWLELPKFGCVNVHASLLPRWRGASPIQSAILLGDNTTGVTIMKMDAGVDTGPILAQKEVNISVEETSDTLSYKLANTGAELLADVLPDYLNGKITPKTQNSDLATFTRMIKKEDGLLDFSKPARELERQIRAYYSWPSSYFKWDNKIIKVFKSKILNQKSLQPGEKGIIDKYPCFGTESSDLQLLEVQAPGKNKVDGKAFLNGARNWLD